jgi:alpha-amylase
VTPPVKLVFGVHLHQPVGNFDHVFEQHVREAYQPFLRVIAEREFFPIALHLSGPLLEWLEAHDASYLDLVGRLVADGRVELLSSGFDEPILAALPRADRVEQVGRMREAIRRRFGAEATGLWLTERVWEPDLAADLALAGVRFALVDDRHFLVSGFSREQLHRPFWTEADGRALALLAIDERLRYLVPFKPPADTVQYLRALREAGQPLAVLLDDGEKFGGWPGTHDWVFRRGWLNQFLDAMSAQVSGGEVSLVTPSQALDQVLSGGLAYLPTASYREMEGWALPDAAAARLARLEKELGPERLAGPEGALVRGAHWRSFLVKYPEANRMHKKMLALSALCRARGDPPSARRAIGRAQCNDVYWHGVFGGLYLPHLRAAVWRNLAIAERELRNGEPTMWETLDFDSDGHQEIWVHSESFSALLSPVRGASLEEFTRFGSELNLADTLTRRREAYHEDVVNGEPNGPAGLPPVDHETRALFTERVLPASVTLPSYASGDYAPLHSWAKTAFQVGMKAEASVVLECRASGPGLHKSYEFAPSGELAVSLSWEPGAFPPDAVFTTELSLVRQVEVQSAPAADVWTFPITTTAKSERGLEETVQGQSVTLRWPATAGRAVVRLAV